MNTKNGFYLPLVVLSLRSNPSPSVFARPFRLGGRRSNLGCSIGDFNHNRTEPENNISPGLVRGLKQLPKVAAMGMVLFALALIVTACGQTQGQAPMVRPTWIEPQVSGTTVSILASEVEKNTIVHFRIPAATGGSLTFMAYTLDGKMQVRANVCPPCRSTSFSLSGDTLVCNTCATVFNAKNGEGISGNCVNYPKAAVAYENSNGNLNMNADALVTAYQNTLQPGLP